MDEDRAPAPRPDPSPASQAVRRAADADLPDLAYAVALATLPDIGPARLRRELASATTALLALRANGGSIAGAARCWERLSRSGIAVLRPADDAFPPRLAADPECPALLFVRGSLPLADQPSVAVIGTRSCTPDGAAIAAELSAGLAESGVVVVSGLATGIDQAAHRGVLRPGGAGAAPLAVVAGGVDVVYPRGSAGLLGEIQRHGAVVSEAPPGARPERWRFPLRNRLIAALSDVVVVVESHRRGGSLVTVNAALRRGVPIAAVPGSVRSLASEGCNDLLADGAHVVRDADDILVLLGLVGRSPSFPAGTGPDKARRARDEPALADPVEREVLAVLERRPLSLDEVLRRAGRPLGPTAVALASLAGRGLAEQVGAGWQRATGTSSAAR